jgi:tetratricopeptide (TPR) repeat protein
MRLLAAILVVAFAAAPLAAERVKLKAEDKDFEATIQRVDGDTVTYTRGRKELTARLDDFEPASAFEIKRKFTPEEGAGFLKLASFALHRALYAKAGETAREAARLDPALQTQAERVQSTARILQADALVESASVHLDRREVEPARTLFKQVVEQFGDTPARLKAEILLGTLDRVELEIKARELEQLARKAQEDADATERAKRKPVDDWLAELAAQVEANRRTKMSGDTENVGNQLQRGLPIYEDVVKALNEIRKRITENRQHFVYRGQNEQATTIDKAAQDLIVDTYERWVYYLYRAARYETAANLCNTALKIAPADRRLLSLKVDIDNLYDPTDR